MTMTKNVLIVYAQPESTSLTRSLVDVSIQRLKEQGHTVITSDLYGMNWKAVFDADDFPARENHERLSFIRESGHAYAAEQQTPDVTAEQQKLRSADAVIFHFPLWWFSMPAILKGWIDRVFAYGLAYGYQGKGNTHRYGEGGFAGKRALLAVAVGGPEIDYSPRGINGSLEQLLFPISHGTLFFTGMEILPTYAVYSADRLTSADIEHVQAAWRARLDGLFSDAPIPFRHQNDGDYPDRHVLAGAVASGITGIVSHVRNTNSIHS